MFKFTRKMNPNFEGVKSFCVKGEASRSRKNFGSGWAVSAARKMRLGWFLLTLLCPAFVSAQVSELWVARYHGSVDGSADRAVAMALDSAGHVYVTGQSQDAGTGFDYATVAYDPKGNQLWAARYNGTGNGNDLVNGIAVDSKTAHVYVTGQSQGTGTGSDYATVAYDFQGNQLWVARYHGSVIGSSDGTSAITADSSTGNVYVTGLSEIPPSSNSSGSIGSRYASKTVAYDSRGNQLWAAMDCSDQAPFKCGDPKAIAVDSKSGTVYVTGGRYNPMLGDTSFGTLAYDSTGTQLWIAEVHGEFAEAVGIALGPTGNIYLTGPNLLPSGRIYTTVAYDPGGTQLWRKAYQMAVGPDSIPSAIAVDSNTGNVYATGQGGGFGSTDFATVAYDSNGNQLWVADNSEGLAKTIAVDSRTGNVYVAGQSQGAGGGLDYATVVYDSSGHQLWTARHSTGTANAIAVDGNTGNVYVTGQGQGTGSGTDFTTIAYSRDNTPPVTTATASPGPNANGWNNTNVTVTLNSTDSESGGSGAKQIQYALSGAQSLDAQMVPGGTASALITAEGMTTLNYFGTDNAGNAEQSKALTVQIDKTPPVVSGMPASGCTLWPPNGRMVEVAAVTAADALSGVAPGSFQLTGSSNEPSDPSNPDVVITPNGSGGYVIQLRARRLGSGTGRIYTLNATATDLAGNTVTSTATCSVPRDGSAAKAH
ncbi:MAG: hypothetical protein DMG48_05580 [Acidobacteria bacterium]|nr:MAG: hypothetical protein DMG48_05580 [Acidobacteriota bacterium]